MGVAWRKAPLGPSEAWGPMASQHLAPFPWAELAASVALNTWYFVDTGHTELLLLLLFRKWPFFGKFTFWKMG